MKLIFEGEKAQGLLCYNRDLVDLCEGVINVVNNISDSFDDYMDKHDVDEYIFEAINDLEDSDVELLQTHLDSDEYVAKERFYLICVNSYFIKY